MKFLIAFIAALLSITCQAQVQVVAPVNIAMQLYRDCVIADLTVGDLPVTKPDIQSFVFSLNEKCIDWSVAWTPYLIKREGAFLTQEEIVRFNERRGEIINSLSKELRDRAGLK